MITALNVINLAHSLHGRMSTLDHSMLARIAKNDTSFTAKSPRKIKSPDSPRTIGDMTGPVVIHLRAFFSCLYNDLITIDEAVMLDEDSEERARFNQSFDLYW